MNEPSGRSRSAIKINLYLPLNPFEFNMTEYINSAHRIIKIKYISVLKKRLINVNNPLELTALNYLIYS